MYPCQRPNPHLSHAQVVDYWVANFSADIEDGLERFQQTVLTASYQRPQLHLNPEVLSR